MRTVKPEYWTSEQVVECSRNARLLFIGLWNFCDDAGIHPANIKRLKMEVFPADALTDAEILEWISELISVGLLVEYEAEDKKWWQVTGWKHQRIDRPNCRHPQPDSTTIRRTLDDHSTTVRPRIGKGKEQEQEQEQEGKGEELKSAEPASPSLPKGPKTHKDLTIPPNLDTPDCRKAIDEWLTHKRRRKENYKDSTHLNGLLQDFARDGPEVLVHSIKICIQQDYKGLFNKGKPHGNRSGRPQPQIGPGQRYDPDAKGGGTF